MMINEPARMRRPGDSRNERQAEAPRRHKGEGRRGERVAGERKEGAKLRGMEVGRQRAAQQVLSDAARGEDGKAAAAARATGESKQQELHEQRQDRPGGIVDCYPARRGRGRSSESNELLRGVQCGGGGRDGGQRGGGGRWTGYRPPCPVEDGGRAPSHGRRGRSAPSPETPSAGFSAREKYTTTTTTTSSSNSGGSGGSSAGSGGVTAAAAAAAAERARATGGERTSASERRAVSRAAPSRYRSSRAMMLPVFGSPARPATQHFRLGPRSFVTAVPPAAAVQQGTGTLSSSAAFHGRGTGTLSLETAVAAAAAASARHASVFSGTGSLAVL
ncbi:unnamed protein product [Ectocarpus sp. CCAP 1310/34]|nr:unnamed protein product [Ectocarpus sp. CCAP 1310/34]